MFYDGEQARFGFGTRLLACQRPALRDPLFADPPAIYESAPLLHRLGSAIAAPALSMRARRDFVRMVRLGAVNLTSVFVVACRSVLADAPRAIGGRAAFDGVCLLCSNQKK